MTTAHTVWGFQSGCTGRPVGSCGGLRLPADPDLAGRAADLAVREVASCSFLTFALSIDAGSVWMEVTVAPQGRAAVDSLSVAATAGAR